MSSERNDVVPPRAVPPSISGSAEPKISPPIATPSKEGKETPLDAFEDARELVRLLQCAQCSLLLRDPLTLPCGNSLCRQCIPKIHMRQNISYPATAARLQGLHCPFAECRQDHAVGDCSQDITLSKLVALATKHMDEYQPVIGEAVILLEERGNRAVSGQPPRTRAFPGGRLNATYKMVKMGELAYDSEVAYKPISGELKDCKTLDIGMLEGVKEKIRTEADCLICYCVYVHPYTTTCGHTFCRKCLQRSLSDSSYCPICRRLLSIAHTLSPAQYPTNKSLASLLAGLWPEELATRRALLDTAKPVARDGSELPLFVLNPAFPSMPAFLHIFEPRYRLMMSRVLETGDRRFGMVLPNPEQLPQVGLGTAPFFQYGTELYVTNSQELPNGRSVIETIGLSRFRVLRYRVLDEYLVGQIERVDDIGLAHEEELEAAEITVPASGVLLPPSIDALPTQGLMTLCMAFVQRKRAANVSWLRAPVFQTYGPCPTDLALFPWWFACIVPIHETEKYVLLRTTSVRERLKVCVGWVQTLERVRE